MGKRIDFGAVRTPRELSECLGISERQCQDVAMRLLMGLAEQGCIFQFVDRGILRVGVKAESERYSAPVSIRCIVEY